MNIHIRDAVREVYLTAFPESERQDVAALAADLLCGHTTPATITLVAGIEGDVVGSVSFSPVTFDDGGDASGYILAPLGVKPAFQHGRCGSQLVESGLERVRRVAAGVVLVYGDPEYYGRFGFSAEVAARFRPPFELEFPFGWQAKLLSGDAFGPGNVTVSCVDALRDPSLW